MKVLLIITAFASLIFQGCIITNTPGFYSGYRKLNRADQERIQFVPANQRIPDTNRHFIYAVNAQSIFNSIQNGEITVVYIWSPNCHSEVCASLQSVQTACNKLGYNLYVVTEYYDMDQLDLRSELTNPLLSINQKFYETDYCPKYIRLFSSELRQGKEIPDSSKDFRYYLFNGNKFITVLSKIPDTPIWSPLLQIG